VAAKFQTLELRNTSLLQCNASHIEALANSANGTVLFLQPDSNCNFPSLTANRNISTLSTHIQGLPLSFHSAACRHGAAD
jgi:hypothetical protein